MHLRHRAVVALLGATLVAAALPASGLALPRVSAAYHTPGEVRSELRRVARAHPDLVRLSSIGRSAQGQPIMMAKVSDHPELDEAEPEVFVNARIHAREHMTTEQALALLGWLTDGYATSSRIRDIVDRTEVFIVPDLNPDGARFDLKGPRYQGWRKNRQRSGGATGTDLNRNFGYRWGCCGGSDRAPSSNLFRGLRAFSAPETRVVRRLVEGHRFVAALSLHSYGGQVLWPYGYTMADQPRDMPASKLRTVRRLARGIAARNGYRAMQASSLYITSGSFMDWALAVHGIPTLTVELMPRTRSAGGFYPPSSRIGPITRGNRDALLWFLEQAQGLPATH
ncbi:MAG: M14 family metallopeptidase [Chloroflexota bacterium]